jgi:hypothetical protein
LKDHKAAVRREATEGFLGSSSRSRLHDMGSRYDLVRHINYALMHSSLTCLRRQGLAENDTSLQTLHKRIPKYRKEEDSDNDSVHEIRPTARKSNLSKSLWVCGELNPFCHRGYAG